MHAVAGCDPYICWKPGTSHLWKAQISSTQVASWAVPSDIWRFQNAMSWMLRILTLIWGGDESQDFAKSFWAKSQASRRPIDTWSSCSESRCEAQPIYALLAIAYSSLFSHLSELASPSSPIGLWQVRFWSCRRRLCTFISQDRLKLAE
jgi:hypothetical protein